LQRPWLRADRDRERKAPGDPDNPLGRARLIFDPPYSIHGTDEIDSLGTAASHGSIRVANPVVVDLARLLLQAGGGWQGEAWFQERVNNRTEMTEIRLDRPVAIEVRP
jgi:murein L,D-transpeptidase YcbB/YkuD